MNMVTSRIHVYTTSLLIAVLYCLIQPCLMATKLIRSGDQITLNCSSLNEDQTLSLTFNKVTKDHGKTHIVTQRPSQNIRDESKINDGRVSIDRNKWGIIRINKAGKEDEGEYYCKAKYQSREDQRKKLFVLTVQLDTTLGSTGKKNEVRTSAMTSSFSIGSGLRSIGDITTIQPTHGDQNLSSNAILGSVTAAAILAVAIFLGIGIALWCKTRYKNKALPMHKERLRMPTPQPPRSSPASRSDVSRSALELPLPNLPRRPPKKPKQSCKFYDNAYDDIDDSHYETSSIPEEETIRATKTDKDDTGYEEPVRHYLPMKSTSGHLTSDIYIHSDACSTNQDKESQPASNEYSYCWDGAESSNCKQGENDNCVGTIIYEQDKQCRPIYANKINRKSLSSSHLNKEQNITEIIKLGGMRSAISVPGGLSSDVKVRITMETQAANPGNVYTPNVTMAMANNRKRTETV